jgi:hypothetical protein
MLLTIHSSQREQSRARRVPGISAARNGITLLRTPPLSRFAAKCRNCIRTRSAMGIGIIVSNHGSRLPLRLLLKPHSTLLWRAGFGAGPNINGGSVTVQLCFRKQAV